MLSQLRVGFCSCVSFCLCLLLFLALAYAFVCFCFLALASAFVRFLMVSIHQIILKVYKLPYDKFHLFTGESGESLTFNL